jgi:hypothetical protein
LSSKFICSRARSVNSSAQLAALASTNARSIVSRISPSCDAPLSESDSGEHAVMAAVRTGTATIAMTAYRDRADTAITFVTYPKLVASTLGLGSAVAVRQGGLSRSTASSHSIARSVASRSRHRERLALSSS